MTDERRRSPLENKGDSLGGAMGIRTPDLLIANEMTNHCSGHEQMESLNARQNECGHEGDHTGPERNHQRNRGR